MNLGDWTRALSFDIAQRLRVSVSGAVLRSRTARIVVTVFDAASKPVAGASVRVSGVGVLKAGRTNGAGKVGFRLRVRKRGRLTFSATKAGYAPGALSMRVS